MQQNNLSAGNPNVGFFIGGTIITFIFLFGVYMVFEKIVIAAKLLAVGGSILSLVLLVPFWITLFKTFKL